MRCKNMTRDFFLVSTNTRTLDGSCSTFLAIPVRVYFLAIVVVIVVIAIVQTCSNFRQKSCIVRLGGTSTIATAACSTIVIVVGIVVTVVVDRRIGTRQSPGNPIAKRLFETLDRFDCRGSCWHVHASHLFLIVVGKSPVIAPDLDTDTRALCVVVVVVRHYNFFAVVMMY